MSTIAAGARIALGDRIIVSKLQLPTRWNVFAFQYPQEPSIIYAKRLVGLPGERLQIFGGDLFADGKRLRKPLHIAEEMWLPLHDTEYSAPSDAALSRGWSPVKQLSGWEKRHGQWTCRARTGAQQTLEFFGLNPHLAYNDGSFSGDDSPQWPLADVRLDLQIAELTGGGEIEMEWTFAGRELRATLDASGEARMVLRDEQGKDTAAESAARNGPQNGDLPGALVTLAVRDGHAVLLRNRRSLLHLAVLPDSIEQSKELLDGTTDPSHLAITARDCAVNISRITLHRDVYYASMDELRIGRLSQPVAGDDVQLAEDEYFALGDNTVRSSDSRFFGAVGEDAIVGTVTSIYWPPSRWRDLR